LGSPAPSPIEILFSKFLAHKLISFSAASKVEKFFERIPTTTCFFAA
jgi:hypothetical protein